MTNEENKKIEEMVGAFEQKTKEGKFGVSLGVSPDDYFAVKDFIRDALTDIEQEAKQEGREEEREKVSRWSIVWDIGKEYTAVYLAEHMDNGMNRLYDFMRNSDEGKINLWRAINYENYDKK